MTDALSPIVDVRHVVFWDEVGPDGNKTLQPVHQQFQFKRLGSDDWEIIPTQNMVPGHLTQLPEVATEAAE